MTTISIKEELNLDKTSFDTLEEFQTYILLKKNEQLHFPEHIKIVQERLKEADACEEPGLSWEAVKEGLKKRRNV